MALDSSSERNVSNNERLVAPQLATGHDQLGSANRLTSIEATMLNAGGTSLGRAREVRGTLVRLIRAAKDLQFSISDSNYVHCFIMSSLTNERTAPPSYCELHTVVLKLFHQAL